MDMNIVNLIVRPAWLAADASDPYGYRGRPIADRTDIYLRTGIDLQDKARFQWVGKRRNAIRRLIMYRLGVWHGITPAPGDLWRLSYIAKGLGDPTGCDVPDPLPEVSEADAEEWPCVINWLWTFRDIRHPIMPRGWDPKIRLWWGANVTPKLQKLESGQHEAEDSGRSFRQVL